MAHTDTSSLLAAVARLVADAPGLTEVVSRLAVALREVIPFDRLHLLGLDRADTVTLYVADASGRVEVTTHRIGDAGAVPGASDESSPSRLVVTMRQAARVYGAAWLTSSRPEAFSAEHQAQLDPIADLLVLALQHNSLRERETFRRDRIESLRRLLLTMAGALDIRHVFPEVSSVVRAGLPHDILALTSWGATGASLRIYAIAGVKEDDPSLWEPLILSASDRDHLSAESYVIHDTEIELARESLRWRFLSRIGVRSVLRVPMSLGGDVFGSLFFLAHDTDRFSEDDLDFARRVSDHLALALSHQRLAETARQHEESRAAAARLEAQVATLTKELESRSGLRRIIGRSKQWKDILAQATRVARTDTTVLLTGESGTGKEVVARFIHHASRRAKGPFVAINCAALPDQLLESELFGHERGAFTGAIAAKPGRIEQAGGGALFLDEVGEMALPVQAKLLRVLEEREFMRLGGTRTLRADIRVIAATNRKLHEAMQAGTFREDLYYRLGVFEIALPALRERTEDILLLADAFLVEIGETVGRPAAGIAPDAKDQLVGYAWPGNVRELRNAIERAVILADGGLVRSEHLPLTPTRSADLGHANVTSGALERIPPGGVNLESIERALVVQALTQARYNKTRAARLLNLTRAQLYSRIQKYGLIEADPE